MALTLTRHPKGPFGLIDRIHDLQSVLAKAWGRPTNAMLSDLQRDGKPVIFLHNPKTGGKSLRQFLHVVRASHSFASDRLSEKHWLNTFSVVGVREPFERFLSDYYDRVLKQRDNGLVKIFGPDFKKISPFEYLEVIKVMPKVGGCQIQWADYPSATKPRADLVLRHETIGSWKDQMIAAGLAVGDREFPHLNRSKRADSNHLDTLKMSKPDFQRLEEAIRDHFRCDYEAFGYPM